MPIPGEGFSRALTKEVSLKTGKKTLKGFDRPPEVGIVMGSDSDLEIMLHQRTGVPKGQLNLHLLHISGG